MSLLNSVDRPHVLTAIETWDKAGGANYMLVRGGVSTHVLLHGGREYDAAAIMGIAHGLATVEAHLTHRLLNIPYTHLIMVCSPDCASGESDVETRAM